MNVGSLFSGIGGFDLGLERAGMRTRWFCEQDEFCQRVLAKHWPGVPCYPDVTELSGANVEPIDLLCGGFPCQDLSVAGKGAGIDGARSGLWSEYARLIGELRPRYVVVENVPALLARGMGRVVGDLAALGYDAEWDCLPASAFGAPHRRDRVWIVAYPNGDDGRPGRTRRPDPSRERQPVAERPLQAPADPERPRLEGHRTGAGEPEVSEPRDGRTLADPSRDAEEGAGQKAGPERERAREGGERVADEGRAMDDSLRRRHGTPQGKVRPGWDGALNPSGWLPEPDVGRVVARVSPWLDGGGVDADAESEGTREVLRAVRGSDVASSLQWTARGLRGVQAAEVLLAALCEPTGAPAPLGDLSLASPEAPGTVVRSVWVNPETACPSCRRVAAEQRAEQHPDALHVLPSLLACDCGSTRLDSAGTATAAENRVDRLSALGNALVPAIAEHIGRRILAYEDSINPVRF